MFRSIISEDDFVEEPTDCYHQERSQTFREKRKNTLCYYCFINKREEKTIE